MTTVDAALIAEACAELGVTDQGEIGTGAQKAVRHVKRGSDDLVLKVIPISASVPTTLKRAEREVELLKSISNPHVVKVESDLAAFGAPVKGAAWLEEFLDGDDLTKLLFSSQWSWADTADMAHQVAEGVAAGHVAGVIHRDLSPNNVRRLSSGAYKVMDFGFARFTLRSGLTVGGQPGTPGFHTPEHLNDFSGVPFPASDVFGVGVLMFVALTGQIPIPHLGDEVDYRNRLGKATMPDLAGLRPDLSPEQVGLVRRCLHAQPARRFRNGQALVTALESL